MSKHASLLTDWIDRGSIAAHDIDAALRLGGLRPDTKAWRKLLEAMLLWLGVLALSAAVTFFIAFNWEALGKFAQFALVQGLVLLALFAYWRWSGQPRIAEAALLAAALLLGTLLALVGQTYQTGADTWQLFATWAVLMLPWALLGRSAVLWLLWLALLNLATVLWFQLRPGGLWMLFTPWEQMLWALFALNTIAWVVWEWAVHRGSSSLPATSRWPQRLLAVASGTCITILVLVSLFEGDSLALLSWLVYGLWVAAVYFLFRLRWPDLFVLAGAAFSLIVTLNAALGRLVSEVDDTGITFLLLTCTTIGSAGYAAVWLRRLHREFES
jgi:uncharacterized membrane protein